MKFSAIFAVIAAVVASVGAIIPADTNALRLARGLTPLAPRSFASRAESARRAHPSGEPHKCDTGEAQCCQSVGKAHDNFISILLGLLNVHGLDKDTNVGVTCSPLSLANAGEDGCSEKPVCCDNNSFNGIVAVGCSPLHI